ncbi:MAG: hypothetical protein ABIA04_11465 [Pseudomonadota bacterium]
MKKYFLPALLLMFISSASIFATSNKISVSGGFAPILADESTSDSRVFIYAPTASVLFEYDLSNKFNLAIPVQYINFNVTGSDSEEFTDNYIALASGLLFKFYPYAASKVKYVKGTEETILIENKRRIMNPYVTAGIRTLSLFDISAITADDRTQYFQRNLLGFGFAAGVDFPFTKNFGMEIGTETGTFTTLKSSWLFIFEINFQLGFYFVFQ